MEGIVPKCDRCGVSFNPAEKKTPQNVQNTIKPNITFFGEMLPMEFERLHRVDTGEARVLIVMGSSLQVAFSSECKPNSILSGVFIRWFSRLSLVEMPSPSHQSRTCRLIDRHKKQRLHFHR